MHTGVQVFSETRMLNLGAGVVGSCELYDVGAGNGTQVLCKCSKSFLQPHGDCF